MDGPKGPCHVGVPRHKKKNNNNENMVISFMSFEMSSD
jgi:hypothetical protein